MSLCQKCEQHPKFRDYKYCETCLEKVRKEMTTAKYLTPEPIYSRKRYPGSQENTLDTKRG